MGNLYSFENQKCTNPGAPRAVPANSFKLSTNSNDFIFKDSLLGFQPGMIDVVNNFQWTTSPPGSLSRQEVPRVELREKRLRVNSILAAAAYYLTSAAGSLGTLGPRAQAAGGEVFEAIKNFTGGIFNAAGPSLSKAGTAGLGFIEQQFINRGLALAGAGNLRDVVSKNFDSLNSDLLKAYDGLYLTEDTKFFYNLPYFSNACYNVNNLFTAQDTSATGGGRIARGLGSIREGAESLAAITNFSEPGVYIERPKFFNFEEDGDSIELSFPLINTGWSTYQDVVLNWQLVFLLTYQNRPNRRSRELIDPSCLYEVTIPGVKYMPFAYIQSLKVDFVGSRRHMNIEVPITGKTTTINTIIPDAYNVTITLAGLIAESRNFLMAALQDKQDVVTVINNENFNPFGEFYNNLIDSYTAEQTRIESEKK
jgi:hypothetical protein